MANTSAPAPRPSNVAAVNDIKRDGGAIRYNADGDQLVTFPADLGARRAINLLHELYGNAS